MCTFYELKASTWQQATSKFFYANFYVLYFMYVCYIVSWHS